MKNYLFAAILLCVPLPVNGEPAEKELEAIYEQLKDDHADLLRGNFVRCDFMGRVKIKAVSIHEELPPVYTVLKIRAEVLELYKGGNQREITYLHMVETPSDGSIMSRLIGTTGIVSLFYDRKTKTYEMGDNGYDLPDTAYLMSIARGLAKKAKRN